MRTINLFSASALAVAVWTCGCATVFGSTHQGIVTKIKTGPEIADPQDRECVATLPREQVLSRTWAVVEYPRARGTGYRTVALPENETFKVGDKVLIDLSNCRTPLKHATP